jgi:S1-C subfamily serine protease
LQQALQTGAPAGTLAVSDVQQNSAAWKAGLRSGTLLTHVDGRRVTTPAEFYTAVDSQAGDVELRLTNAATREVVVSPQ